MSLLDRVRATAPGESRRWWAALLLTLPAIGVLAVVLLRPGPAPEQAAEDLAPVSAGAWPSPAEAAASAARSPVPADRGAAAATVVVEVVGGVRRPGVVRLPAGSRVIDAIAAAGGLTGPAGVNLARVLADGEQVVVGDSPDSGSPGAGGSAPSPGLLDLNAADPADLEELPGIGPVLAERIVQWRTDNGGFRTVAQLQEVPGIGPAIYSELAPLVRVG